MTSFFFFYLYVVLFGFATRLATRLDANVLS